MNEEDKYRIIQDGIVLVDHGPITMTINAKGDNKPLTEAAVKAAKNVIQNFEELIPFLKVARSTMVEIKKLDSCDYPQILNRMIESVNQLNEDDFTPMASVAGTLSDLAKEEALRYKADFAIVNNGGDISFQTSPINSTIKVGVISDLSKGKVTHSLNINGKSGISGIATSGWGGRSLTKGVASAVTVLARNTSYADAAATAIANATNCDDIAIERCLAEELDYDTDIKGSTVTRKIGKLSKDNIITAINLGKKRSKELYDKDMIMGAIIFVQGEMLVYPKENKKFYISKVCCNS